MEYSDIAPSPHRLYVRRYSEEIGAHECDCDGRTVFVDLFISGDFGPEVEYSDLVGRAVEVAYTHGWLWLAQEVRLADNNEPPER